MESSRSGLSIAASPASLRLLVRELGRGQNMPPPPPAGRVRLNTPAVRGLNLWRAKLESKLLLSAFNAHVRSIIEYGSVVWSGAAVTHLKRLERIQHSFLIWLACSSTENSSNLSYDHLLQHFKVSSIKSRFMQRDLIFIYIVFHDRFDSPQLLSNFHLSAPARRNRSPPLWNVPFARVLTVKNGPFCRIANRCNELLNSVKSLDFCSPSPTYKTAVRLYAASAGVLLSIYFFPFFHLSSYSDIYSWYLLHRLTSLFVLFLLFVIYHHFVFILVHPPCLLLTLSSSCLLFAFYCLLFLFLDCLLIVLVASLWIYRSSLLDIYLCMYIVHCVIYILILTSPVTGFCACWWSTNKHKHKHKQHW